ncbi:MAG: hypothetical protein NC548_51010, partial [Lachnospiraceae bacterium]|nr:hypothetical protein [Lachnospiraceae bacterium]
MANFFNSFRSFIGAPAQPASPQLMALARALASKKGVQISAMLQQQTDSLTKKDIADWRNANQIAIDYENPNRCRLYDIYADCVLDAHLSGCIAQRKGKVLQKDFR